MTQDEYIEILFIDLGFSPSQKRAWLKDKYNAAYTDTMSTAQKTHIIHRLKLWKDQRNPHRHNKQPKRWKESWYPKD